MIHPPDYSKDFLFYVASSITTIGMDWSEAHRAKLDCYNKNFECLDEEGNLRVNTSTK